MKHLCAYVLIVIAAAGCTASRNYSPARKFSPQQLQSDYALFRKILEEDHPSLYWYTPKDSVDYYFNLGAAQLHDSLPEYKFRNILSYTLAKIKCGHTTVRPSKQAVKYAGRVRSISFPLNVKAWDDTVVVTSNMNRRDSAITRGVLLKTIDGRPVTEIVDSLFGYISADGYNTTHKYQTISNLGAFRNLYGSVYGIRSRMKVSFIDTLGLERTADLGYYNPLADTPRVALFHPHYSRRAQKRQLLLMMRQMNVDTALSTAFLEVNTFTKGNKLRGFFRRSFRRLRREHIHNLVVDMRNNGGGSVVLSNLLTRYIADKPFKIADSLYALKRRSHFGRYEQDYFLNRLFLLFMTHKRDDGHYHFTLFEQKYFKPKKANHFDGTVYILTGGNTFSAAALFTKALAPQANVTVVGEETGGGAYGNTAWLIPDITLPKTGVRFRLPLFRLVIDRNEQKGRGIIPKIVVRPTVKDIRRNADFKMEKVIELIREKSERRVSQRSAAGM